MEEADFAAVEDSEVAAVSQAALVYAEAASVVVIAACLRRAAEARSSDRARLAASGPTRTRDTEVRGPALGTAQAEE